MKLSISNIAWKKENDEKMYEFLSSNGFSGLEIAPTRIFLENPYEKLNEAKIWAENLKSKYGLEISSIQSIWYGKKYNIFSSDSEREELLNYTKKAIDFANSIGCKNLVFGCPKNRNIPDNISKEKALFIAEEFFHEVAIYAEKNGTVFSLEANPKIYGTNFINTTETAFEIAKKINTKGLKVNFDFGTVIQNTENFDILKEKVKLINHIHISEPYLKPIQKRDEHKKLAKILKDENYSGFVSLEMGLCESFEIVKKLSEYLKKIFA